MWNLIIQKLYTYKNILLLILTIKFLNIIISNNSKKNTKRFSKTWNKLNKLLKY